MKRNEIVKRLSKITHCYITDDNDIRNCYSVDASSYRLKPSIIAFPRSKNDVVKIIKFASQYNIPVTARGAGTGLVGGALGKGVILDMKRMNKIKIRSNHVEVGAGVLKGILDKMLSKYNRFLGPNPSIGPYCTVGGMIATNASGSHSIKYGSMIDNIMQVKIVTSSGKLVTLPKDNLKFKNLIKSISPRIKEKFPSVSKNSCGYRIDKIIKEKDLHKILAGSEGTLGIIISAKLKTYNIPKKSTLTVIAYSTLLQAAKDIPKIVELKPSALEMIDRHILKHIKFRIPNDTNCILFVEFDDDLTKSKKLYKSTSGKVLKTISERNRIRKVWGFRNSALAYSLQSISKKEAMPTIIEDAVVPIRRLSLLLKLLDILVAKYNLRLIIYGHIGDGNLHIRPILRNKDKKLVKRIATEFFSGIIGMGGSISGEHGDGLARSEFVKMQYGEEMYSIFKKIKKEFDPNNILNPGKIISQKSSLLQNLDI